MGAQMLHAGNHGKDDAIYALPRQEFIHRFAELMRNAPLSRGLDTLTRYVGARHYLLARYDLLQDGAVDFVVSSNWPFDLVRSLAARLLDHYTRTTEVEKCLMLLQPTYDHLPNEVELPEGLGRQYCAMTFNVGRVRLSLMLLFPEGIILSAERLRDVGLLSGYCASAAGCGAEKAERDFELTERELECLAWGAEGKTSDEIAMILGISRNTINNYIGSIMRKTATKTRSEAIACAVRNHLV